MKNMLFFLLGIFTLFTACSDDADIDIIPPTPTTLKVVSCDFVKEEGDLIEPVKNSGGPSFFKLDNNASIPALYHNNWESIKEETSLFSLYEGTFPKAANLAELKIRVPILHADGVFPDVGSEVPLTFNSTVKMPDVILAKGKEEILVPAYSIMTKITERTGFKCAITFYLVLADVNTGEQYQLSGMWHGSQISTGTITVLNEI